MSLLGRIKLVRREYLFWRTERALWRLAHANKEQGVHNMVHIIGALECLQLRHCTGDCSINGLPQRLADRVTNALVPDVPPEDWT